MQFSCIIPCKHDNCHGLRELRKSIRQQDFDQDQIEIIHVSEGDSESAKAIGIKKAKGKILAMFCCDNFITNNQCFKYVHSVLQSDFLCGVYTRHYAYVKDDNSLNRYFSLMGVNDPIAWWLGKADRLPWSEYNADIVAERLDFQGDIPSLGDNGFFVKRKYFIQSDLDHYYPMDNCLDIIKKGYSSFVRVNHPFIWHRTTDGNLWTFLKRRYYYAAKLYCDRRDRRWKIISKKEDFWKIFLYVIYNGSIIWPLITSWRGFIRTRDRAYFWHYPVCAGFLAMYGLLTCRCLLLSVLSAVKNWMTALKVSKPKPSKIMR